MIKYLLVISFWLALVMACGGGPTATSSDDPPTPPTKSTEATPEVETEAAEAAPETKVESNSTEEEMSAESNDSIGVARMDENGMLYLQLRAEGADGTVGDAMFQFPPTHKKYQYWLDRLGGLEPGQSKPVPASK